MELKPDFVRMISFQHASSCDQTTPYEKVKCRCKMHTLAHIMHSKIKAICSLNPVFIDENKFGLESECDFYFY